MDWDKVMFMVFNATFYNILVIPWRSVLLVHESHNVISSTPRLSGIRTQNISGDWP
jgi:hypothetical protein